MKRAKEVLAGFACVCIGFAYFVLLLLANTGKKRMRVPDPFAYNGPGAVYNILVITGARLLPRKALAITYGKYVFCKRRIPSLYTLRHEFAHSDQYRQYGFFSFLWRYGVEIARYGYDRSPLEQEAYQRAIRR